MWAKKLLQEEDAELLANMQLHFISEVVTFADRSVLAFDDDEGSEGDIVSRTSTWFHLALADITEQSEAHKESNVTYCDTLWAKYCVVKGKQSVWVSEWVTEPQGPVDPAEVLGWFLREVSAGCVKMTDVEEKDRRLRESEARADEEIGEPGPKQKTS